MKMIQFGYYPGGKLKAVTMSFDDGQIHDRRLVEIFNKYGIKGTFHLNSGRINEEWCVGPEEFDTLYKGHEISLHSYNHPSLAMTPPQVQVAEMLKDRQILEEAAGYIVNGMSYPNGSISDELVDTLKSIGVVYSRTTLATGKFKLPDDFLLWHPTMHYSRRPGNTDPFGKPDNEVLMEKAKEFVDRMWWYQDMPLLSVWGHSYEFDKDNNWEVIENFCEYISKCEDVWFATNIEIYNYVQALKSLQISADCSIIYNPSATDVWIAVDREPVEIKAGTTVKL